MACNDEDCDRSRRPVAEDRKWSHRSGTKCPDGREVGWRRIRSATCTWRRGAHVSWLSLKTKVYDLSVVWPQNHCDDFSRFGFKTDGDDFLWFGLKMMVSVSWLSGGGGFPNLALKTGNYSLVIWYQNHHDDFLVWV
jgi:hypothetical protein